MVYAVYRPLQVAPKAFNRIGMACSVTKQLLAVVHHIVAVFGLTEAVVADILISVNTASFLTELTDYIHYCVSLCIICLDCN